MSNVEIDRIRWCDGMKWHSECLCFCCTFESPFAGYFKIELIFSVDSTMKAQIFILASCNKKKRKQLTCEVWLTTDCWWWLLVMWLCLLLWLFHSSRPRSLSLSRSLSRWPVSSNLIGLSSSVVSSVIDDKRFSFNFVANLIAYCKENQPRKRHKTKYEWIKWKWMKLIKFFLPKIKTIHWLF